MENGNQVMQEIAAAIQEGAAAFLNREYTFLGGFVVVVAVIIAIFLAWQTALSFVLGAIASGRGRLPGHVHRRARQCAHRCRGQQEPG